MPPPNVIVRCRKPTASGCESQLQPLRAKGIPLVAIDYLPPERREEARKLAKRLREEGFIPFISTPELDSMGISSIEVQPRRIAMIYDPREDELTSNAGHTMLGGLIEYLGYRVDYLPADDSLPEHRFSGLYAGIITWMTSGTPQDSAGVQSLAQQAPGRKGAGGVFRWPAD